MEDVSLLKKTCIWTGALLGVSVLWVALVSLSSVLIVGRALPEQSPAVTSPATPTTKPASEGPPSRPSTPEDASSTKRRNG